MRQMRLVGCGLLVIVCMLPVEFVRAQRVRFPSPTTPFNSSPTSFTTVSAPGTGVTLGQPTATPFDPYGTAPTWGATPSPLAPAPPNAATFPPTLGNTSPTPFSQPSPSPYQPLPPTVGPPTAPALPGTTYPPTQPPALFPNGIQLPQWGGTTVAAPPYQRLFDDFYMRYTWLEGEPVQNELEIHEVEVAVSAVFPSVYSIPTELRVTPGFIFDFLQGPVTPPAGPLATELPAQLYSAYLDTAWNPQITQQFSAQLNVRMGIYSDFQTFTNHSIRLTGTGLMVLRLTPTVTIKGGVEYLDRNKIKLLPAGGILWEPDPQTRWDIYFPRPKLAKYLTTMGNSEVWWYIGAEYGGGSWTFEHSPVLVSSYSERVDYNDIRMFFGVDITGAGNLTAFFEGGYVFERELVYVVVPTDSIDLQEAFMLRAGLIW